MATYEPYDKFYRKAKAMGLPSRAAFKIEEIIARHRMAPKGARIVDLGCAPGGWLAILARAVGTGGRVVGVDLAPCRNVSAGAIAIVGDILNESIAARVANELGGGADLVTSDLAPKLTGIAARDQARSRELIDAAIEFTARVLKPGGAMVAKMFMGEEFKEVIAEFKQRFGEVEVMRTKASRPGSSELYVIARNFKRR
ncbi:MAG: RlmE family RNA methyltransferase [Candidatus Binatus sp.]|uniref:RlmE family RNA methyltransferase n=1 Tax=Candidatus Binatus sp. TaxID=2811406 RepID=UPI002727FAB5|nr:RlmE family RNA methyltransferase [Candidatus Binatus sp.]MDO8430803.1 RlmE family RNA methyltransferase [Candidatus Binatus sp.]